MPLCGTDEEFVKAGFDEFGILTLLICQINLK